MPSDQNLRDHERELIQWVTDQPENGTVTWSTHHLDIETPFAKSWIDVQLHGSRPLEMNWAVTIESEDSVQGVDGEHYDGSMAIWQIVVPYDGELRMRFDRLDATGIPDHVEVRGPGGTADITAYAHRPWKMADERWQREMFWNHYQQVDSVTISDVTYPPISTREGNTIITPVWTPAAVTDALTRWTAELRGRDDLTIQYNPTALPSEMYQRAQDALDDLIDENGNIDRSKTVSLDDLFGDLP